MTSLTEQSPGEDAAWMAEQWDGPFVIKGILQIRGRCKTRR